MRRLGQEHIQSGRGNRCGRHVPFGLGRLYVSLQSRLIPSVDVSRAVKARHATRVQICVRTAVERINERIVHAEPRERSKPVVCNLAVVNVGRAKIKQTVLRSRVCRLHQWSVNAFRVWLVRRARLHPSATGTRMDCRRASRPDCLRPVGMCGHRNLFCGVVAQQPPNHVPLAWCQINSR